MADAGAVFVPQESMFFGFAVNEMPMNFDDLKRFNELP